MPDKVAQAWEGGNMRRVSMVLCSIWLVAFGAWASNADHDSRSLTASETDVFMHVICPERLGMDGKMVVCARLVGLSRESHSERRFGITLTAIAYGDFRGTGRQQAYVTYDGDFEPHATNFGGGILLRRTAGKWTVIGWYSGGQMDQCVALPPAGKQRMLCLSGYSGQGEVDSSVWQRTVPRPEAADTHRDPAVLKAQDSRETGDPEEGGGNYQCTLPRQVHQAILLSIDNLRRSHAPGILAEADIVYAKARDANRACARKGFAKVREIKAVAQFKLVGDRVVPVVPESFAKTDY